MPEYYIFFGHNKSESNSIKISSILPKIGYHFKRLKDEEGAIEYKGESNLLDLMLSVDGLNKIVFYPTKGKSEEEEKKEVGGLVNKLREEGIEVKSTRDIFNKPVNV